MKNGKRKTKIKSEGSNWNVFLIHEFQSQKKSPNLRKVLFFLLIFCRLFLPTNCIFSLCLETEKREGEPPVMLEEAALRAPSWRNLPSSPQWKSPPTAIAPSEKELISRTREGDWISRWISDRLFSSGRLCTTCLSSPCRTPSGTSSPPHGVSWFLVLI